MSTLDLFDDPVTPPPGTRADESGHAPGRIDALGEQIRLLRGYALPRMQAILAGLQEVERAAPVRHLQTSRGHALSAATTNCGHWGWHSDRRGYRYTRDDPQTGRPWPPMPPVWHDLARDAAQAAGFAGFASDACLVNRYAPGSKMGLHQDKNERDFSAPIVSLSLGMSVVFLFGGLARGDPTHRLRLDHGDILVWGGVDRLRYHGVMPLRGAAHDVLGHSRVNLTFRKAT